jgi:acyl-CoA synthetase (AMP-forming)/AMP-acid ligase II
VRVDDLLEESARRTPDHIALVCAGERRSYRRLDQQANRLAHELVAAGIKTGDRVVICRENSIDAVVAMFAVLKAGGAFAVINPQSRAEHLSAVLADSGAAALMAKSRPGVRFAGRLFTAFDAPDRPSEPPASRHSDADLAALVYTSGSTGVA